MRFSKTLAAGESQTIPANGDFVRCDKGTRIRVTAGRSEWEMTRNEGAELEPFSEITLENISGADEFIEVRAGYGRLVSNADGDSVVIAQAVPIDDSTPIDVHVDDSTPVQVEVIDMPPVSVSATVNQSNQVTPLDDVTLTAAAATQIAGANTSRKELMIKNPVANTAAVRIGDATAAANKGFELEPGESLVVTTTAAVYAYSAAAQDMSLTELEFV